MAGYLNPRVLDNGLSAITSEANRLYMCTALPTTYADATSTYGIAYKASIAFGSPVNATPTGRKVVLDVVTGGTVTSSGTATHYAVVDTVNSRLLEANTLTSPQVFTAGNSFSTNAAIEITLPGLA